MPEKYRTTIKTFNAVADKYLAYFKDFTVYQPTYDCFLTALNSNHQNLLELACGPGQVSHYLLKHNQSLKIHGIDLAPRMIQLAQQLNPTASYAVMDCRDIKKLKQKYDAIMCAFCLPYLSDADTQQLLCDMVSLLNKGGILYISISQGDAADNGYQYSDTSAGAVYVHYHDIDWIRKQLSYLGMTITAHDRIEHIHHGETITDVFLLAKKC